MAYRVLLRTIPQTTEQNFNLSFSDSSLITKTWSAQQWKRKRVWWLFINFEPKFFIQLINQSIKNEYQGLQRVLGHVVKSYWQFYKWNPLIEAYKTPHISLPHDQINTTAQKTNIPGQTSTNGKSIIFVNSSTNSKWANKLKENTQN